MELFYEAKEDGDASVCAAKARMTADYINNIGRANTNRRRRQTEEDVDPIFNFVTIAAAMEVTVSTDATTNPPSGSGASVIIASCSVLLASMLLAVLMF